MFNVSNKIILVSLAVTLLCSVFVYYSMRQRLNQTEQNMDTMFNLVSSLNDEQKRIGNLVVYSIKQQEAGAATPMLNTGEHTFDESINTREDGGPSSLIMQEIEHSTLINLNDATDDEDEDEQPTNMIDLLLQGQADLRVVVSDDEGVEEGDSEGESDDENLDEITDLKHSVDDESSSDDEDERTVELNKLKVNDLKHLLETLSITKGEIAKAKKLKKNELVDFIKHVMAKADAPDDVNVDIKQNDVDNVSSTVIDNEDDNEEENEEDNEEDNEEENEEENDVLEQVANLDDDSDLEGNDNKVQSHSLELTTAMDEPVVELNDDDFNK